MKHFIQTRSMQIFFLLFYLENTETASMVEVEGNRQCQGRFPYRHRSTRTICYTRSEYANAGFGPCHSWCTFIEHEDDQCNGCCGDVKLKLCDLEGIFCIWYLSHSLNLYT